MGNHPVSQMHKCHRCHCTHAKLWSDQYFISLNHFEAKTIEHITPLISPMISSALLALCPCFKALSSQWVTPCNQYCFEHLCFTPGDFHDMLLHVTKEKVHWKIISRHCALRNAHTIQSFALWPFSTKICSVSQVESIRIRHQNKTHCSTEQNRIAIHLSLRV